PVKLTTGQEVVPLKVVKALLPDPKTLAPGYTGKTCIGNFVKGWKNGKKREVFIYQVSDHHACYEEIESQGISYTAGVPPVAAAMLVAQGVWDPKTMVNVEELDPEPFIAILDKIGLPTDVKEIKPGSKFSFDGTVRDLAEELAESTATVTVSAANPIIAIDKKAQEAALQKLTAQGQTKRSPAPAKKTKAAKVVKKPKAKTKKAAPKKVVAKKKSAPKKVAKKTAKKAVKAKAKKSAPKKVVAKKAKKKAGKKK
ncbi:MAG: saccharopine dehydrogenase C-terminal domain-containing protein, partial [Kiritimatiellales bacterium]